MVACIIRNLGARDGAPYRTSMPHAEESHWAPTDLRILPQGGNKKVMSQIKSQMHVKRNIHEGSNSQSHARSRDLEEGPKFISYELVSLGDHVRLIQLFTFTTSTPSRLHSPN